MKYLKMLGLAAIAAAGLMAFLGAGTASATVLCETTPAAGSDCVEPWKVNAGVVLDFSAENSTVLTGPFGEVIATCTASTVQGELTAGQTGSTTTTPIAKITSLTWTGCGTRTVTANSATTGELEIHHETGTDNGTVTSNDTTVTITNVPIFGTCNYQTANTDIGTLTGRTTTGADPTFDIAATIPHEAGSSCPNGTWEGSYVYTGTTTFDVVEG